MFLLEQILRVLNFTFGDSCRTVIYLSDEHKDYNRMHRVWADKQAPDELLHKIYRPITGNISFIKLQKYN
jgi:hypothetical protein